MQGVVLSANVGVSICFAGFTFTTVSIYTSIWDFDRDVNIWGTGEPRKGLFVRFCRNSPHWAKASSFTKFLDHTQRHTTVGMTPLDERSARRRDLYLTTHNAHNRETSMPPVGFEPAIPASERPQTHPLDRAATETGEEGCWTFENKLYLAPAVTVRNPWVLQRGCACVIRMDLRTIKNSFFEQN